MFVSVRYSRALSWTVFGAPWSMDIDRILLACAQLCVMHVTQLK